MNKKKLLKRVGIGFASILALAIIIFVSLNFWTGSILNKDHTPNEKTFGNDEKQALIIYQPSNGTTAKTVNEAIGKQLSENGYTVTINTPSNSLDYNLSDYDLLVFGSPVYFGQVSNTLEDYIKANSIKNKEILLVVTGLVLDEHREEEEMKAWFDKSNTIYTVKTNKEKLDDLRIFVEENLLGTKR